MTATKAIADITVQPGDLGYLVRHMNTSTGSLNYLFVTEVPQTNLDGRVRAEGWLGTTDGDDAHAMGRVEVEQIDYLNYSRAMTYEECEADEAGKWAFFSDTPPTIAVKERTGDVLVRDI